MDRYTGEAPWIEFNHLWIWSGNILTRLQQLWWYSDNCWIKINHMCWCSGTFSRTLWIKFSYSRWSCVKQWYKIASPHFLKQGMFGKRFGPDIEKLNGPFWRLVYLFQWHHDVVMSMTLILTLLSDPSVAEFEVYIFYRSKDVDKVSSDGQRDGQF